MDAQARALPPLPISYRTPSLIRRKWFSLHWAIALWPAALLAGVILSLVLPLMHEIQVHFGTPTTEFTQDCLDVRAWLSSPTRLLWTATPILLTPFLVGAIRGFRPPVRQASYWRSLFISLTLCLFVLAAGACALADPFWLLHHRNANASGTASGGCLNFESEYALYAHIASKQGVPLNQDNVLALARGCHITRQRWFGGKDLIIIEPWGYRKDQSYFRGAQGNGDIYVAIETANGMQILAEAGGNDIFFQSNGALFTTSWHMGGGESGMDTWRWDGQCFRREKSETIKVGVD